jgi:hypothetical protein
MLSSRNLLMMSGLGALLAIVALFAGVVTRPGGDIPLPAADASPPTATSTTTTTTTTTSTTPTTTGTSTTTATATATVAGADERGFVNSAARCDQGQTAVAFGRTQRSEVAVCTQTGDSYEYRGVRISDGATLTAAAEATGNGVFTATNDGAAYTVSPEDLVVTSGGKVIYRDTWTEYEAPSFAAEHGTTTTSTSTPTTSTSSTSTSTSTTSATPTTTTSATPTTSTTAASR